MRTTVLLPPKLLHLRKLHEEGEKQLYAFVSFDGLNGRKKGVGVIASRQSVRVQRQ